MRKLLIILSLSGFYAAAIFAQGEIDQQQKIFFRNERSFAVLLNSDGIGISYREAKRVDFLNKRFFEIETGTLKHPREYRESNPVYQTPGTFVYGKINSVFYLRGSYGHQHELYKKADLGGVAVRFFYSGGPVLAVYKPIYYRILYPVAAGEFDVREEKLDVNTTSPDLIYSRASFTKGLNETKVLPGLFSKADLTLNTANRIK